jgi:hypothetical protein
LLYAAVGFSFAVLLGVVFMRFKMW